MQYKYNHDYCNSVTEEFFDLVNDPLENNNLINNDNTNNKNNLLYNYRIGLIPCILFKTSVTVYIIKRG